VPYYKDIEGIKALGVRIRFLRKLKGFSQEALAIHCNLPSSQISRIETGTINTSVSHVFLIAKVLEVHPKELFDF
jgi:transcriptional regulator with XRE-family HTH domain